MKVSEGLVGIEMNDLDAWDESASRPGRLTALLASKVLWRYGVGIDLVAFILLRN